VLTGIGAFDIIGLALDTLQPQPSILPTILASRDLPDVMLYDRPATPARISTPIPMKSEGFRVFKSENTLVDSCIDDADPASDLNPPSTSYFSSQSILVHRPKPSAMSLDYILDSASEDEGFSIVHRPKPDMVEDPMSSPEIVPSNPVDVLAATGSNYPDEDDWTML
jgi:hypothetical protein